MGYACPSILVLPDKTASVTRDRVRAEAEKQGSREVEKQFSLT
jgi:hypothetical protein